MGLAICHDHGSATMSDDFPQELPFLGMSSSPSSVGEPEGIGVAKRFVRTLKENLLWVRAFATVAELVEALREFKGVTITNHGPRPWSEEGPPEGAACGRSPPLGAGMSTGLRLLRDAGQRRLLRWPPECRGQPVSRRKHAGSLEALRVPRPEAVVS